MVVIKKGKVENVLNKERFDEEEILEGAKVYDLHGQTLSPGFVDTHIHVIAGVGTEDALADAILEMSEKLAQFGVTGFCPTLYPQPAEKFINTIKEVSKLFEREKGAKIIGLHLEGPFISPNVSFFN